ncbi:hypothetical protein UlMin_021957 [Ulmus minor]
MTVLRSRKIVTTLTTPKRPKRKRNSIMEPTTPAQNLEPSASTPPSSGFRSPHPVSNSGSVPLGFGSDSASRRRSSRIASKSAVFVEDSNGDLIESGSVGVDALLTAEEAMMYNGENVDDFGLDLAGDDEGSERVRVFEVDDGSEEMRIGSVEESVGEAKGEWVATKHVKELVSGLCDDWGNLQLKSGDAKGKRKLGIDINLSPSELSECEVKDGFLNLRSGKKVAKRDGVDGEGEFLGSGIFDKELIGREDKGKGELVEHDFMGKTIADGNGSSKTRSKFSREEKGKGKLLEDNWGLGLELGLGVESKSQVPNLADKVIPVNVAPDEGQVRNTNTTNTGSNVNPYMTRFRDVARRRASHFAHFDPQEDEQNQEEEDHSPIEDEAEQEDTEDWPGPFSTAMKIIEDRNKRTLFSGGTHLSKSKSAVVWVPKKSKDFGRSKPSVPSLIELSLVVLANNADAIASLEAIPDVLRHRLSQVLCDSRRMNGHFFGLLVHGSPTEVRLKDCSGLTEEQFTKALQGCDSSNLTVLQLDQCGRCLPDYVLISTLAPSLNSLPALNTISLRGACRLSDAGLTSLVSAAPGLTSINLSQCSLLSSSSIDILANSLGLVLRELYLDDCQSINAMHILPALKKFEKLEVLSLAGVENVCDAFIKRFVAIRGHNLKELVLADCGKLTDSSLKAIAKSCPGLCTLDLMKLCKLTDSSLGYLANGCRSIQTLKLCRNPFSDESMAAFLETSGGNLKEFSLNNIKKVGEHTAIALAKLSTNLRILDLSWCRNLTDDALGLIVDSCQSLKLLKLFGCTQLTNAFLDGYSNPEVKIIGISMTPVLEDVNVPDLNESQANWSCRYSSI